MAWHKWDPVCHPPRALLRPVPIDPRGIEGPTRGQAAGPRWRRSSRGFYVPAEVDATVPEQRILEAVVRLPGHGAVTGWAGCRLFGANYFDGLGPDGRTVLPVPLLVGPGATPHRGKAVTLSYATFFQSQVVRRQQMPVLLPEGCVFDAMRWAPSLPRAVAVIDMAVAALITSPQRVATWSEAHAGATNIRQARAALALSSEHSRSGPESELRVVLETRAGLPRLEVNCEVLDQTGRLLGIADLLDVEAGLVIEFDGAEHRGIVRHTRDLAKDEDLRRVGLEVTRFSGTDLRDHALVVSRARSARARARFAAPEDRRWVAQPRASVAEETLREREAMARLHATHERDTTGRSRPA